MQIPEQTAEFSTQQTQGNAMTTANTALSAHTMDEDFAHFKAYTGNVPADERLRLAYEHGDTRASTAHHEKVLSSIDADMLALANRIAASTAPDDDRGEVAYAIARYLKLSWPSADLGSAS